MSGAVSDGHDPVAGATVSVGSNVAHGDAVTQADGSFVLEEVPRGNDVLRVSGYEVREPKSIVVDRPELSNVKVIVDVMGSISGRVTRNGKPFAGAEVGGGRVESVISDDDGNYHLRGLLAGKYHLWASSKVLGAFGSPPDVTIGKGEQRTGVDIDMQYAGSISGTIVEANGNPAAGVYVRFEAQHLSDGGDDTTALDGSFRCTTLMGGDDYYPFVRPNQRSNQRFAPATGEFPTVRVADVASQVTGVRLVIKREHLAISGTTVDGNAQPLSDVRVAAVRTDSDEFAGYHPWYDHPNAISGTDGSFMISDLDAGSFMLEAHSGDGSEATVSNVAAGTKNVVIKLQASGGIDGTLVGFATPPTVVTLRQQGGAWTARDFATVDGNTFRMRGLAPGDYTVMTTGQGGDAQAVHLQAGQIATVTLRNRGTATVKGRAYDWKSGAPVSGFTCKAGLRASGGSPAWDANNIAITDESGEFTIQDAPAGNIGVGCMSTTNVFFSDGMAALTVAEGQTATVEIPVVERNPDQAQGNIGAHFDHAAFLTTSVALVQPRGPADRAGIRVGDIVTTVDGQSIAKLTPWGAEYLILDHPFGVSLKLGLLRSGNPVTALVIVAPPFTN